jgi:tyrosinase
MTNIPDRSGGGCVTNGPFASTMIDMGPGNSLAYNPHCLRRDFAPNLFSQTVNSTVVQQTLAVDDFWHLNQAIQGFSLAISGMRTHAGGHIGVGGMVGEVYHPGCPNIFSSN